MFKADKVNHMEMVNHPAMTEIFNDIFNRSNLDVPEFFVVPLKGE